MASAAASLALDPRGLDKLRVEAGAAPDKAIRDASRQFETLFVNMLLKSMREATAQDGPLDSEQTRMYTGMLDQQLAQAMSARGIGLADVMVRQLSKGNTAAAGEIAPALEKKRPVGLDIPGLFKQPAVPMNTVPNATTPKARDFINKMWPHAVDASRATGIPAHFIIGQAALESGWGSREIRTAQGAETHNLFGIKAGQGWSGSAAQASTTEFIDGVKQKVVDKFRQYSSYAEAFKDYANMLKGNPRYAGVLQAGQDPQAFAQALQKAGYATDPAYANKLTRIITSRVLQQGLSG
ncbi:MAG: flagellar assembly peptidoglycan hydrolase FlgJ [Pseudomonadota bacterium]